jgi:uncharacterized protein YqgV (UPF0045/DUF77 family)
MFKFSDRHNIDEVYTLIKQTQQTQVQMQQTQVQMQLQMQKTQDTQVQMQTALFGILERIQSFKSCDCRESK